MPATRTSTCPWGRSIGRRSAPSSSDLPVVQETNTPIGAALARVPSDLAGAEGTKIVLLITDGEETCGGDPAAAVRDLRRRGVDARVNLVGFALQDRRLKARMAAWARIGNGSYFDARSGAQLAKAVARAISAPYRILDAAGNEVARGTVDGAPVPIEPGTYSVIVLTDPTVRFDGVEVEPGGKVALAMTPPAPAAGGEEPAGALDGTTPGAEDGDG